MEKQCGQDTRDFVTRIRTALAKHVETTRDSVGQSVDSDEYNLSLGLTISLIWSNARMMV
jgi:hypothetical protein